MKYFLGEIIVTHRKTWLGWVEFTHIYTTQLVLAEDWLKARDKFNEYAVERMAGLKRFKYITFVTPAI